MGENDFQKSSCPGIFSHFVHWEPRQFPSPPLTAHCILILTPCAVSLFLSAHTRHEPWPAGCLSEKLTQYTRQERAWKDGEGRAKRIVQEALPHCSSHTRNSKHYIHSLCSCFFYEWCFRGVEESIRFTDTGWLSCLQDDVHCTYLSFTKNLIKVFPSWTTTLPKLPSICCYSLLPSRQNYVRKTQCGTELVNICYWTRFRKSVFPRGKDL